MSYAKGMSQYVKLNHDENIMDCIIRQYKYIEYMIFDVPLLKVIINFGILVELIVRYVIVLIFPYEIVSNFIIWLFVFPLGLPGAIKLAIRYDKFRCIHNHKKLVIEGHHCSLSNRKKLF